MTDNTATAPTVVERTEQQKQTASQAVAYAVATWTPAPRPAYGQTVKVAPRRWKN